MVMGNVIDRGTTLEDTHPVHTDHNNQRSK
jgi:hypothetical protein